MSAWTDGIAPAQALIECGGERHTLRWEAGRLHAVDHGDPRDEATLAALAGQPVACLDHLRAWERHRQDARVLVLGARGRGDVPEPRRRRGSARVYSYGPRGRAPEPTPIGIPELLTLGGGLPDRLQAHVVAAWERRLQTGHRQLAATGPLLHAALYGRLLVVLRAWLGEPELDVELTMVDAAAPRTLRRTGDGLDVQLPFAWLAEVWSRGLALVFDRLVLAAELDPRGHWHLHTLASDLSAGATITIGT